MSDYHLTLFSDISETFRRSFDILLISEEEKKFQIMPLFYESKCIIAPSVFKIGLEILFQTTQQIHTRTKTSASTQTNNAITIKSAETMSSDQNNVTYKNAQLISNLPSKKEKPHPLFFFLS